MYIDTNRQCNWISLEYDQKIMGNISVFLKMKLIQQRPISSSMVFSVYIIEIFGIIFLGINNFSDKSKPPNRGSDIIAVYGALPPKRESFEDICGPPTTCPDCPDPREFKCKDTLVTLYDLVGHLEIKPTENVNYPGLPNRTFGKCFIFYCWSVKFWFIWYSPLKWNNIDCVLYAVGKPVYHKFTDQTYGSWLKDPLPRNDEISEKIWATNESDSYHLYEYANKAKYRNNMPKVHTLKSPGFKVIFFFLY